MTVLRLQALRADLKIGVGRPFQTVQARLESLPYSFCLDRAP